MQLTDRVLFRDANLLVLDKPAGLTVHPGPAGGPSVEASLPKLTFGLRHVPVPAHRLDRDTSGCLVLARHPKARTRLGRLFEAGKIGKTYWAVVRGDVEGEAGTIDRALAKRSDPSGWRMVVDPQGQRAVTHWRLLGRGEGIAWMELTPETGRTHQIRVHAAAMGWPLVGEPAYAAGETGPLHLLARHVAIPYWAERPPVVVEAQPPEAMRALLAACGWRPESEL